MGGLQEGLGLPETKNRNRRHAPSTIVEDGIVHNRSCYLFRMGRKNDGKTGFVAVQRTRESLGELLLEIVQ